MTQEQVFQECQNQVNVLPEFYKSLVKKMGLSLNNIKSHYVEIEDTTVYPINGKPVMEDIIMYLVLPHLQVSDEAKLFLLKLYTSAYYYLKTESLEN